MKERDIAVKNNEDTKNNASQSRKKNRRTDTKTFCDTGQNNPYPAFSINLTPNNGWVLVHIDKEEEVSFIAENIPAQSLAEKALQWFKEGKYQPRKMNRIRKPRQLSTLVILSE